MSEHVQTRQNLFRSIARSGNAARRVSRSANLNFTKKQFKMGFTHSFQISKDDQGF